MFRIILFTTFIYTTYKWSDWRNWRLYYPSVLFFIICSLLYNLLYYNYPLWKFEPLPIIERLLPNNTLISITVSFTIFPCTTLLYLSHLPKGKKELIYMLTWVLFYTLIELISIPCQAISYHNGWHLGYSIIFNIITFSILRIHHKRPLVAWGFVFIAIVIISAYFKLPLDSIK